MVAQDPSSGQTYYANQITGEAQWEPPLAPEAPAPQLAPAAATNAYAAQQGTTSAQPDYSIQGQSSFSQANGIQRNASSTSTKVASKYGDGFVTSASNPQLAEQYGNVGTR